MALPIPWIWHAELRTDIENNRRKKKKTNIDTSSIQNPFSCAEFQRILWACAPKPRSSVSDHQPSWCTVRKSLHLRLANQAGECGRSARMKCYFQHGWLGNHVNLHPAITYRDLAGDGRRMESTKSGRVKPLDPSTLRVRCGCKRTDSSEW